MNGLNVLGALLLFAVCVYLYLVFPVRVVVSCAKSATLGKTAKAWWMVACIVIAPIGTWAYCLLTPQSARWKATAYVSIVATVLLFSFSSRLVSHQSGDLRESISAMSVQLQTDAIAGDSSEKAQLVTDLGQLTAEVQGGIAGISRDKPAAVLADVLQYYLRDKRLTLFEFEDWHARFKQRHQFDPDDLAHKLKLLRGDTT